MHSLPLVRRLQLMRSQLLVRRLHLAPRRLRKQPPEGKNSIVSSELTATYCARPLAV
jgi:hypothetical protein